MFEKKCYFFKKYDNNDFFIGFSNSILVVLKLDHGMKIDVSCDRICKIFTTRRSFT